MIAAPKHYLHSGDIKTHGDTVLWVECEITHPPSRAGQSVDLFLDVEDVTRLLVELRSAAIRVRRQGEHA